MNEDTYLQDQIPPSLDETPSQEEGMPTEQDAAGECALADPDLSPDGECDLADPDLPSDGDRAEDNTLSAPDGEDQNSALPTVSTDPSASRVESLERELAELRELLAQRDAQAARMEAEMEEFSALYPQVAIQSLPDSVWADVGRGIPISAAYALAERKRFCAEALAAKSNQSNKERSSGALSGTESDYFSPSEVRSMSPSEVRSNYKKIMYSMQKWH